MNLQRQCEELLLLIRRLLAHPEEGGLTRRVSPGGSGLFREHRKYIEGDDLRYLDWHAYARTGKFHVKLFEKDRTHTILLLLDLSASMDFGEPRRWLLAVQAAKAMVYVGLVLADQVSLVVVRGDRGVSRMDLRGEEGLDRGWDFLDKQVPGGGGFASPQLEGILKNRRGGILWWISDFMPMDEGLFSFMERRRIQVRGIMPMVEQDRSPDVSGFTLVRNLEDGRDGLLVKVTKKLRDRVSALWEEEMNEVRSKLKRGGGGLFFIDSENFIKALASALV